VRIRLDVPSRSLLTLLKRRDGQIRRSVARPSSSVDQWQPVFPARRSVVDEAAWSLYHLLMVRSLLAGTTRRLPHGNRAILDIRKLEDYRLSASHPRGRHKARVFRETLDLHAAMRRGCETLCLKPRAPGRPHALQPTRGEAIGGLMLPSGDTERAQW
jgi:hypothetical protein